MRHLQDGSDATLIKQAQEGDGEAAGLLYDRYHQRIYRFVRARVATCEAAEDITGEVFTRMVDHLPGYQERGRPFGAWLYQIGRNLLKDRYRQNGQVDHLPIDAAAHLGTGNEGLDVLTGRRLALSNLREMIGQLEPDFREVIELRFLAGLSLAETAEMIDESVAAVKSRQHRALKALRHRLPQTQVEY